MRDALRTCLQIAGGLTEATRRRAVGAARELLDQTGVDVEAVRRRVGESIPPEVQALADELVAAGRANRDLLVGLIREEVDKTKDRVGRVADEVTKVGVILEALERRVRNLEGGAEEPAPAAATAPPRERVRVAVIQTLNRDVRVRRVIDVKFDDERLDRPAGAADRTLRVRVVFEVVTGESFAVELGGNALTGVANVPREGGNAGG